VPEIQKGPTSKIKRDHGIRKGTCTAGAWGDLPGFFGPRLA
jgi:hypothetical protein